MQTYNLVFSAAAISDLDDIVDYICSRNLPDAGNRYRIRILKKIKSLECSAGSLRFSRKKDILQIHPRAKSICIMNRKWTVVFHIENTFVVVDRIVRSSLIAE